jgi:hypothetical protein
MNYTSIFAGILKAIMDLARPSIIVLWHLMVNYGLNPEYSYKQFINGNTSFISFYRYIFYNVYSQIILVLITSATIIMLLYNSFIKPYPPAKLLIKIFAAIVLFESSYKISMFFIGISLVFYNNIYSLKTSWYGLEFSGLSFSNSLLSILFTGTFVMAIMLLFGILIIRQALILFFILFMPVASLLLIIPGSEKQVLKLYRIFFELAFFPFFTIIILYLIGIFNNPFLEIGLIYVAATAPLFFVTEIYRYFQGSMNFLDTDAAMTEISSGIGDLSPGSVLNGGINFGIDPDTSENLIPGIIDESGGMH